MKVDEERLSAYLDGELPPAEREAVERLLAADADAAAWVAEQRELRAALASTFDAVLQEPVPEHLVAAARGAQDAGGTVERAPPSPRVTSLEIARERAAATQTRRRWGVPEWAAIAASFVVGVLAVYAYRGPASELPIASRDGLLVARGELADALTERPAGARSDVAIAFTFRDRGGAACRAFSTSAERGALAGYACRRPQGWVVDVVAPAAPRAGGDYAQAASGLPASVLAAVDETIDGEPLDAAAEAAVREGGWREVPR